MTYNGNNLSHPGIRNLRPEDALVRDLYAQGWSVPAIEREVVARFPGYTGDRAALRTLIGMNT